VQGNDEHGHPQATLRGENESHLQPARPPEPSRLGPRYGSSQQPIRHGQAYNAGYEDGLRWDLSSFTNYDALELATDGWASQMIDNEGIRDATERLGIRYTPRPFHSKEGAEAMNDYDAGAHAGAMDQWWGRHWDPERPQQRLPGIQETHGGTEYVIEVNYPQGSTTWRRHFIDMSWPSRREAEKYGDRWLSKNDAWRVVPLRAGVGDTVEAPGRQATRPGKHGTLKLWKITYKDADDPAAPDFTTTKWAYDKEAASLGFYDSNDEGESWEIIKIDPVLDTGPRQISRETPTLESHRVADFTSLDDLIAHAHHELGATHVVVAGAHTQIFFRRGGQYPYEAAKVWRKGGYWHAEGPGARTGVKTLPKDAQPIEVEGGGRRAAEPSTARPRVSSSRKRGR